MSKVVVSMGKEVRERKGGGTGNVGVSSGGGDKAWERVRAGCEEGVNG